MRENEKHISTKKVYTVILIGALFTTGITASGKVYVQKSEKQPLSLVDLEPSIPLEVPALKDVEEISTQYPLMADGTQHNLYGAFNDPDRACAAIEEKIAPLLQAVRREKRLPPLTPATVERYHAAVLEYWQQQIDSGESAILSQYSDRYFSWECFKQIFDSYKENEEIVKIAFGEEKVDQYAEAATTMEVDATVLDKIGMLLPYTTPLAIETEQTLRLMQNAEVMTIVNGFDVDKGTLYARKYATSPNTGSYYYFSHGDCTNFVSQILENGGVAQQVYASISQGWWHKVTNHTHTPPRGRRQAHTRAIWGAGIPPRIFVLFPIRCKKVISSQRTAPERVPMDIWGM